jgi:ATP-dependent Zn protease
MGANPVHDRKKTTELERTAYHEAGHVVAHFIQNIGFRYVTIIPSGDALGYVKGYPFAESFRPDMGVTLRMRDRLEKAIVIYYAGNEAEKKFCGRYDYRGSSVDFDSLVDLASYVTGGGETLNAYLKWLQLTAHDLISMPENWQATRRVAEALLEKKKLTSNKARDIFTGRKPDSVQIRHKTERKKPGST